MSVKNFCLYYYKCFYFYSFFALIFFALIFFLRETKIFSKIKLHKICVSQSYLRKRGEQDKSLYPGYRIRIPCCHPLVTRDHMYDYYLFVYCLPVIMNSFFFFSFYFIKSKIYQKLSFCQRLVKYL